MPSWACWTLGTTCLIVGAYSCAIGGWLSARGFAAPGVAAAALIGGFVLVGFGAMLWRVA